MAKRVHYNLLVGVALGIIIITITTLVIVAKDNGTKYKNKVNRKNDNRNYNNNKFEERFNVVSSNILINDIKADEEFKKCIDENANLNFITNGKYPDCHNMMLDLASSGIGSGDNIGFGKINELCPISSLSKAPKDCMENRLEAQYDTIEDITKLLNEKKASIPIRFKKVDIELKNHKEHIDNIYSNENIQDFLKHINKNEYINHLHYVIDKRLLDKNTSINKNKLQTSLKTSLETTFPRTRRTNIVNNSNIPKTSQFDLPLGKTTEDIKPRVIEKPEIIFGNNANMIFKKNNDLVSASMVGF
jgi:hypothetical protein